METLNHKTATTGLRSGGCHAYRKDNLYAKHLHKYHEILDSLCTIESNLVKAYYVAGMKGGALEEFETMRFS